MSADFFSSVPVRPASTDAAPHGDFAHAIDRRFGAADLRTARLLPGDLPHPYITPPQARPPPLPSPQPFSSVPPSALAAFLDDPRALVLDIRPHAAHAAARINNAISLSVPTTLLKRPLFSLSKLSLMLPSPSSRARFADWFSASRILVYDSDSVLSPDNSITAGLLRKFRAEGFTGELGWVCGGFQAVWREARHLATTDRPLPEEEDPDAAATPGTLRASYLPKAAFSLSSTIAAHPRLGPFPPSYPLPNTPSPSASRAANPFFDTIRQNIELSHGITDRIPLRLPRCVRRRVHDLPFPWLRDIAHRSALRHTPASRHPGFDSFESGSESSDDPHTSDPDENDPNVEEGAEALAMQFYRIELAEQRRLRSIMEHHTKESELANFFYFTRPRRSPGKGAITLGTSPVQGGVGMRTSAKSVPGTPHPTHFPFSITAGVEKGTKNRYTHIWPFEHARVRLHDGRHQGSHPGRRDKGKVSDRGRNTRDRLGEETREQGIDQSRHRRSRSSPAFSIFGEQVAYSRDLHPDQPSSITTSVGRDANPPLSPRVPQVKIEYDVTEQDSQISGSSTPASAFPLLTSPFYTPMETFPAPTPMHAWPPHSTTLPSSISVSPGTRLGVTQLPPASPSFPLRLPDRPGGLLPSIGEQTWSSESLPSYTAPFGGLSPGSVGEVEFDVGLRRREPSPVDDYVNASYVQPLGTRKRYIATQGPLPSTYIDFWTLVWEQNVHVIVMLTREIENAMVKCGSYWTDTEYGPLRLELLSTSPPMSPSAHTTSTDMSQQGFFTIREQNNSTSRDQPALITRIFSLSHTSYPGIPPRRITHLQYLEWSDMNVPDDPRGILDLVQKLERVVAESTPGPSPSGSMSPGSASGSLSGSQSPDTVPDQNGYGASFLSPTSAGFGPRGRRRGSEWRHPELDPKTGIAAFALDRTAPVLLHCSAGVGRTGGFITVDAVLDGIRRELRKKREEQILNKASGAKTVVHAKDMANMDGVKVGGELSFGSIEEGARSMESRGKESTSDTSECMDVDEPATESKTQDPLHMINTVPIPVSAGDHTKGRRHHHHSKGPSSFDKIRSSPGSLVVHVPCMGSDYVPEETNVTGIALGTPTEAGWQSSSTREWAEQVSDQTHVDVEEDRLPLPSLPLSSRERSPGSTSISSGPSTLNSADDSMNGSGNNIEQKSGMNSARESGAGYPAPSSVSKPRSGSISLSTSGSGSGTDSRLGSSLLYVRLRDSSVTSISAVSTDSLSPGHEPKLNSPLHGSLGMHASSGSDMEIDCPPRPVSAPLQPIHTNTGAIHSQTMLGLSPVASLSSPLLPPRPARDSTSFFGVDAAERSASRPSLETGSNESPPQEFVRAETADTKGSGKILLDESETPVRSKFRSNLQLDTEFGSLKVPGICYSAESPTIPSGGSQGRNRVVIPRVLEDSTSQHFTPAPEASGAPECDQRNVDQQVIDYKLPRQLHSDLSPPLISSFAEPICMVIQDMREQRMSLCQSLRQYVFVHAAIIEGALRIADEERELWGSAGTSDDASSGEGEPETSFLENGHRSGHNEGWLGQTDKGVTTLEPEHPYRSLALDIAPHAWNHGPEVEIRSGKPPATASCASSVSSPSKGKRGPSPTELLREDKAGALSLNKRPNHRQTTHDQGSFSIESSRTLGEHAGGRDTAVGTATRSAPGRPGAPEKVKSDFAVYE